MWGQGGDSSQRASEWLIRTEKETRIVIAVSSEKGGTDRREIALKA